MYHSLKLSLSVVRFYGPGCVCECVCSSFVMFKKCSYLGSCGEVLNLTVMAHPVNEYSRIPYVAAIVWTILLDIYA